MHLLEPSPVRPVVVVGQLSVDEVVALDLPVAVGEHNPGAFSRSIGGTGAIVAHNMAVLGVRPLFCGHVGASDADRVAARELSAVGVDIGPTIATPVGLRVVVVVGPDGERTMFANSTAPDWSRLQLAVRACDICFFEGWHLYDAAARDAYCRLITRAARTGAAVVLDACTSRAATPAVAALLAELPLDVVLANELEAEALGLLHPPPSRCVVVHRGGRSTLLLGWGAASELPVDRVDPVDTTGAGDTFAAGFLSGLSTGLPVPEAVLIGQSAARHVVTHLGPLLPVPARSLAG